MTVASPQQVMLEVRFIEASRNLDRGVGVNWARRRQRGSEPPPEMETSWRGHLPIPAMGISRTTRFSTFKACPELDSLWHDRGQGLEWHGEADVLVSALEEKGLARELAEPNLIALSGDTASFLAGGEFPFPSSVTTNGQISVEFKKFGVGLAFTPTVLSNGQINLKIEPEVSELDHKQLRSR